MGHGCFLRFGYPDHWLIGLTLPADLAVPPSNMANLEAQDAVAVLLLVSRSTQKHNEEW